MKLVDRIPICSLSVFFFFFLVSLNFSFPSGNIRVYCRIRPFLAGQKDKRMTIEHVGENGEVVIANPTKPGKEGHRLFKFNKVYSPVSTQGLFLFILSYGLVNVGWLLYLIFERQMYLCNS